MCWPWKRAKTIFWISAVKSVIKRKAWHLKLWLRIQFWIGIVFHTRTHTYAVGKGVIKCWSWDVVMVTHHRRQSPVEHCWTSACWENEVEKNNLLTECSLANLTLFISVSIVLQQRLTALSSQIFNLVDRHFYLNYDLHKYFWFTVILRRYDISYSEVCIRMNK